MRYMHPIEIQTAPDEVEIAWTDGENYYTEAEMKRMQREEEVDLLI